MQVEKPTKNEREILKMLLDNGRITDMEISEQLSISPQAIGKIRRKLEDKGIIKGYRCILDFEKIGLHTFAMIHVSFFPKVYADFGGLDIYEKLRQNLRILFCCIPSDSEVSIICLFGFRNMVEMDDYFKKFKVQFRDYCEIKRIIPFSYDNLLSFNSSELLKRIIDGEIMKPITPNEFKLM